MVARPPGVPHHSLKPVLLELEDFATNLDEDITCKMCRNARKRAQACVTSGGGHFEHLR